MPSLAGLSQGLLHQGALASALGRMMLDRKRNVLQIPIVAAAHLCTARGSLLSFLSGSKSFSVSAPELLSVVAPDEGIPKKPNTPWVQFVAEKMPSAKQHFPEMHPRRRMQKLSQKWRELPMERKMEMEAEYREARIAWLINMEMVSEEVKEISREEKRLKKKVKQWGAANLELKKLLTKLEKPSKPANSFILYCTEQGWEGRRMFDGMASEWRQMGAEKKDKYVKQSVLLKEEYELEMKEWKERMWREGWMEEVMDLQQRVGQLKKEARALEETVNELRSVQTMKGNSSTFIKDLSDKHS